MANAPDSLIVTGSVLQQVSVDSLLVTPTGGLQTTLAQALANGGGGGGQWNAGFVNTLGPGFSISVGALEYTQNWTVTPVSALGTGVSVVGGALTVTQNWTATPVSSIATGLSNVAGVLSAQWSAGAVAALGSGVSISSGTLNVTQNWAAAAVSAVGNGLTITSGTLNFTKLSVSAVTANTTLGTLPANAFVLYALFRETAGTTVSVGIGSTSGATDVLGAVQLFASTTLNISAQAFPTGWFSSSATQALFLSSSNWNGASVNVALVYIVGP